jgi:hypothetical protein
LRSTYARARSEGKGGMFKWVRWSLLLSRESRSAEAGNSGPGRQKCDRRGIGTSGDRREFGARFRASGLRKRDVTGRAGICESSACFRAFRDF